MSKKMNAYGCIVHTWNSMNYMITDDTDNTKFAISGTRLNSNPKAQPSWHRIMFVEGEFGSYDCNRLEEFKSIEKKTGKKGEILYLLQNAAEDIISIKLKLNIYK